MCILTQIPPTASLTNCARRVKTLHRLPKSWDLQILQLQHYLLPGMPYHTYHTYTMHIPCIYHACNTSSPAPFPWHPTIPPAKISSGTLRDSCGTFMALDSRRCENFLYIFCTSILKSRVTLWKTTRKQAATSESQGLPELWAALRWAHGHCRNVLFPSCGSSLAPVENKALSIQSVWNKVCYLQSSDLSLFKSIHISLDVWHFPFKQNHTSLFQNQTGFGLTGLKMPIIKIHAFQFWIHHLRRSTQNPFKPRCWNVWSQFV